MVVVTIEWDAIKEIRGTQVADVVTYDDRRFIGYEGRDFETSVDVSQIISEQTDSADTRCKTFAASYAHDISPRWQANGTSRIESDEQQGLESRELVLAYRLLWATDIDTRLTFFPNLEESSRLRAQSDGTLCFASSKSVEIPVRSNQSKQSS